MVAVRVPSSLVPRARAFVLDRLGVKLPAAAAELQLRRVPGIHRVQAVGLSRELQRQRRGPVAVRRQRPVRHDVQARARVTLEAAARRRGRRGRSGARSRIGCRLSGLGGGGSRNIRFFDAVGGGYLAILPFVSAWRVHDFACCRRGRLRVALVPAAAEDEDERDHDYYKYQQRQYGARPDFSYCLLP